MLSPALLHNRRVLGPRTVTSCTVDQKRCGCLDCRAQQGTVSESPRRDRGDSRLFIGLYYQFVEVPSLPPPLCSTYLSACYYCGKPCYPDASRRLVKRLTSSSSRIRMTWARTPRPRRPSRKRANRTRVGVPMLSSYVQGSPRLDSS